MKKVLIIIALIACIAAAGVWYLISGAGGIIKAQIEEQGSKYLDTKVAVFNVELVLSEGRMTISDLDVENPEGFSDEDAFSIDTITLDLGTVTSEPYTVQTVAINAPEMLYEMDASGKGNLIVLKDNIQKSLPTSSSEPSTSDSASPLVIVENVTVSDLKLKLDFEKVDMGGLTPEQKTYEITLPTFNAGSIGKPNGIPADQVGLAIADAMLDNVIAKAKKEAKDALKDQAKDKLLEKTSDKLKGLFN